MARTLHYRIVDDSRNTVSDEEWEQVLRLQHWYNSEFIWTAGRLALKMYAVFPNWERRGEGNLLEEISRRKDEMRMAGYSENAIILRLAADGYITARKGGYADNCIASGFTKVAGNEFDAYLVCEFLLKASTIARNAEFSAFDEGRFIKPRHVRIRNAVVRVPIDARSGTTCADMVGRGRVFSIVNPRRYDDYPIFGTVVSGYNDLEDDKKLEILRDWNWLGFGENYDLNGDDVQGFDLNDRVVRFETVDS